MFRDARLDERLDDLGYAIVPFLTPAELEEVRSFYDELHQGRPPPEMRDGVHMTIWCRDRAYKEKVRAGLDARLGPALHRLAGPSRMITPVFTVKESGEHTEFPVHQDWSVVDEETARAFNFWIPLRDVGAEDGTLWVVPGSHRWGSSIRGAGWLFPNLRPLLPALEGRRLPLELRAGQALLFFHRLIHGSPPNVSGRPRACAQFTAVEGSTPLRIYFQASEHASLEVYEPPDDFIYEFDNVRDDTAWRPPRGEPVEVRPPFAPAQPSLEPSGACRG